MAATGNWSQPGEAFAYVLGESVEPSESVGDDEESQPPSRDSTDRSSQPNPADTIPTPIVDKTPEQRGQAALAKIDYPWAERLPEWEISFHPEQSGVYGYTLVKEERIEIYVRDDQSDDLLAHVVAHEIGHAVDITYNDGDERDIWLETRGIQGSVWWPQSGASDFSTGAGDFAESFAAWQVGPDLFRSNLAPAPTATEVDVLQRLALD